MPGEPRKLTRNGHSVIMSLPPRFLKENNLRGGDFVMVSIDIGCIRITPLSPSLRDLGAGPQGPLKVLKKKSFS